MIDRLDVSRKRLLQTCFNDEHRAPSMSFRKAMVCTGERFPAAVGAHTNAYNYVISTGHPTAAL